MHKMRSMLQGSNLETDVDQAMPQLQQGPKRKRAMIYTIIAQMVLGIRQDQVL